MRWIGNENGLAPDPTWSTGSCEMGNGGHGPLPQGGDPDAPDWCPAEVDSTLQANDAWFWLPPALNPLNSLAALVESYHASRGRNSNWLLGLSPTTPRPQSLPVSHRAAHTVPAPECWRQRNARLRGSLIITTPH